jgi:hypothetical protein
MAQGGGRRRLWLMLCIGDRGRDPWACLLRALRLMLVALGSCVRQQTFPAGGAPLLLDGDAGPAPLWWWGRGSAGACWWCRGGASGGAGLLRRRCRGCGGLLAVENVRQEWYSGRKSPLSVAMVVAPWALLSLLRAPLRINTSLWHGFPG